MPKVTVDGIAGRDRVAGGGVRLLLALMSVVLFSVTPASAQSPYPGDRTVERGSAGRAAIEFHYFIGCVARKYSKSSVEIMNDPDWDEAFIRFRKIARQSECARDFDAVGYEGNRLLIRGGIAESLFEESLSKREVFPQFIGLAPLVTTEQLGSVDPDNISARRHVLMFVFSDCVARNATSQVVGLLRSGVMSKDETQAIGELGPFMSSCMPASDGTQIRFSKSALRSYLAIATYYLDRAEAGETIDIAALTVDPDAKEISQEVQN